jgi:prevent-host-death family protein
MTISVGVEEAKAHLSSLLAAAREGQDVQITRRGQRPVRLVPVAEPPERELGFLSAPPLSAGFFDPLPDSELAAWEGE